MGRAFKTLTIADIVAVNHAMITTFGGFFVEADENLGNPGSLEHVLEAIQGSLFGRDLYPTLTEKAAALCWRIIRSHVFHDGNKRTGMEVCRLFLDLNGYMMRIDRDVIRMAVAIANDRVSFDEFVEWVTDRTEPNPPHLNKSKARST
jgi:death on curing protein